MTPRPRSGLKIFPRKPNGRVDVSPAGLTYFNPIVRKFQTTQTYEVVEEKDPKPFLLNPKGQYQFAKYIACCQDKWDLLLALAVLSESLTFSPDFDTILNGIALGLCNGYNYER